MWFWGVGIVLGKEGFFSRGEFLEKVRGVEGVRFLRRRVGEEFRA